MEFSSNASQVNMTVLKRGFTEKEAATYMGMSTSFLRQSRSNGDRLSRTPGPRYVKLGRSIRYLREDLDHWLEENAHSPRQAPDILMDTGDKSSW